MTTNTGQLKVQALFSKKYWKQMQH